MKNGNSEHDFDSIAELVRGQGVFLEILVHRLAGVEATVLALALHGLPDKTLRMVKKVKDQILSEIHDKIIAEVERDFEDS